MIEREFWRAVYVAAIRTGVGPSAAARMADDALASYRQRKMADQL
jgi:hypothetical protein